MAEVDPERSDESPESCPFKSKAADIHCSVRCEQLAELLALASSP
jgi:hypothetical protein